tara:strand:- start:851 stop:1705 length:855 start_codon:yes stop_codon:yes gene_type:complete
MDTDNFFDNTATKNYQHIVLTRFNTRIPGVPAASDEWLHNRLSVMNKTMLPSMTSQSVHPDNWLVFCDSASPRWFKDKITKLLDGIGEPVWVDEEFSPEASPEVVSVIVQSKVMLPWIITTRLDNDDCVSKNFIRTIQSEFREKTEFLNFPTGAQYENGWIYFRSDPSNPFISYCEQTASPIRTVFMDGHHLLSNHGNIRQIGTKAMWMQVVHGNNIANSVHGIRANPALISDFSFDLPVRPFKGVMPRVYAVTDAVRLGVRVLSARHRRVWLWKVIKAKISIR